MWEAVAGVAAALIALLLVGHVYLPVMVDRRLNARSRECALQSGKDAREIHSRLDVVDFHTDALLWPRDLRKRSSYGHVDIPRLLEGNVAVQCFFVVTQSAYSLKLEDNSPNDPDALTLKSIIEFWPPSTWRSRKNRALFQARRLQDLTANSGGSLVFIRSAHDLEIFLKQRSGQPQSCAAVLGLEGLHALEGDIRNLDLFYDKGFRIMSPTHFFDNEAAGSQQGCRRGGLTDFGAEVIRRMNEKRIIVDLAHVSAQTVNDVLAVSSRPVMVSHTGIKAIADNNRNLNDDQIRRIAEFGGIIGIGYWDAAVGSPPTPQAIARSIAHVVDIAGLDHVGLGSDFDGSVLQPFDCSELHILVQALLDVGFMEPEIRKIMGQNSTQFLLANLP